MHVALSCRSWDAGLLCPDAVARFEGVPEVAVALVGPLVEHYFCVPFRVLREGKGSGGQASEEDLRGKELSKSGFMFC